MSIDNAWSVRAEGEEIRGEKIKIWIKLDPRRSLVCVPRVYRVYPYQSRADNAFAPGINIHRCPRQIYGALA